MFGKYRLLLALLVVVGHSYLGMSIQRFNIASWAVINFYILSGFVMTALLRRYYNGLGRKTLWFFFDRALRIFPQYLFFIILTGLVNQFLHLHYIFTEANWSGIMANVTIIPLNYYMFSPSIEKYLLIPAAWSLAVEEQFYLLFPLVIQSVGLRRIMIILSIIVFSLASTGLIDTELFGYRLIPGTAWLFLSGSVLYDYINTKSPELKKDLVLLYGLIISLLIIAVIRGKLLNNFNLEVFSGFLIGLPVIAYLGTLKWDKYDELVGRASYGVFLCHQPLISIFYNFKIFENQKFAFDVLAVISSTCFGFAGYYLIENHFIRIRRRVRDKIYLGAVTSN